MTDSMQEKMDRLLEAMVNMDRKEDKHEITTDVRNIDTRICLS